MARLDLSQAESNGGGVAPEGIHLCQVKSAEERMSKAGDAMFSVQLRTLDTDQLVCFDVIMLGGKHAGIGAAKLSGLGFDLKDGDPIIADQLIGRRVAVHVKHEMYQGQPQAKVDIGQGDYCGYSIIEGSSSAPVAPRDEAPAHGEDFSTEGVPF